MTDDRDVLREGDTSHEPPNVRAAVNPVEPTH